MLEFSALKNPEQHTGLGQLMITVPANTDIGNRTRVAAVTIASKMMVEMFWILLKL